MNSLRLILAILLPPLAVLLCEGTTKRFWIDVVLTLFAWIPGVLYAVYVLGTTPSRRGA